MTDSEAKRIEKIAEARHELESHFNSLREGYRRTSLGEVKQIPEVRELIEKTLLKFERDVYSLNVAKIEALQRKLKHDIELDIRKIATEKPKEKETKEEYSHPPIREKEPIEGTPVEKMVKAIENNKKAQIASGNTALAGGISEQQTKNNPLLAFKAEREKEVKKGVPGKSPGRFKRLALKVKGIIRGGNSNRGRESKPEHKGFTQTPAMVQQNKTALNTMLSSIERNKAAQQAKKPAAAPNQQQLANNPLLALKANLAKQTQKGQQETKPVAEKPRQSAEEKAKEDKAKTAAPNLGAHKVLPPYELGNEEYDYGDIGFMDPLPSRGPGSEAIGNPNSELPYGYPAGGDNEDDDGEDDSDQQQDDGGDGDGGGGGNGGNAPNNRHGRAPSRNSKSVSPKLPSNPLGGGSGASAKLAQQGLMAFFRTPPGIAVLICLFLILLFVFLFFFLGDSEEDEKRKANENALQETLTIEKVRILPLLLNPKVGERVTFKITVKDTKPAQEVTIIDHLPEGVSVLEQDVVSSWTKRIYNPAQKTISFKASENITPAELNPPDFSFTVTYLINKSYKEYYPWVEAGAIASASGNFAGLNIPPSSDNCNGMYSSYMSMLAKIGKSNYGDPNCELVKQGTNGRWFIDKDMLLSFMWEHPEGPRLSQQEAMGIFTCILPKECTPSINVNAYNPKSTSALKRGTPGAFGCFQMNAQGYSNQGQPEDVGDVVWQLQIHNANNWRKNNNGGKWSNYWPESYGGCLSKFGLK